MLHPLAQLELRERPLTPPAMYHEWRDLTFLHYAIEPELVQAMLPEGLSVDTFPDDQGHEMAWIGLVPFRMQRIRFGRTPAVPGCHAFPETNVRTYVHRAGKEPGVWFFSLDAANPFACAYARRFYKLPYYPARMSCDRSENKVEYKSTRWREAVSLECAVEVGSELAPSEPGSLEFFLIERYLLYSVRLGRLFSGRVFHPPYPLQSMRLVQCSDFLVKAAGLPERRWVHQIFSPGVDVDVHAIGPCET